MFYQKAKEGCLPYLKATRLKSALILNFGTNRLTDGIQRLSL
jgi:hypothetical protein